MARKPRLGQRGWRFTDGGNKFDGRPRPTRRSSQKPISPTLKRGVIHCKRCGSRVVGNVGNCPFCGKPLRPVFARLWFWLLVVVAAAVGAVMLINTGLPAESTSPSSPAEPERPQVLGAAEDSALKDLPLGTTIDNSGLEVTVKAVSLGPDSANGAQIYVVDVDFLNQTEESVMLYSLQWMLELSDGTRLDTYVGSAADGATISSNLETLELQAGGQFTGRLYFAVAQPAPLEGDAAGDVAPVALTPGAIVYQPSALAYDEDLLVTWKVPGQQASDEDA